MENSDADHVWNRACEFRSDGPRKPGDRALEAMLLAHGLIMNGGVHHCVFDVLSRDELAKSAAGYAYFGLNEVASFLSGLPIHPQLAQWTDETEPIANSTYDELVPNDQYLADRFERVFRDRPEEFAEV